MKLIIRIKLHSLGLRGSLPPNGDLTPTLGLQHLLGRSLRAYDQSNVVDVGSVDRICEVDLTGLLQWTVIVRWNERLTDFHTFLDQVGLLLHQSVTAAQLSRVRPLTLGVVDGLR